MAKEIADFLDGVKENIGNNLHINFGHLDNKAVPLENNGKDENKEESGLSDKEKHRTGIYIE